MGSEAYVLSLASLLSFISWVAMGSSVRLGSYGDVATTFLVGCIAVMVGSLARYCMLQLDESPLGRLRRLRWFPHARLHHAVLCLCIGVLIEGSLQRFASYPSDEAGQVFWWATASALLGALVILVHEIGHVIAALVCGLPIQRICVNALILERVRTWRLTLRTHTRWQVASTSDAAGWVEIDSWELHPRTWGRQLAVVYVGGPLANLVMAFFCWRNVPASVGAQHSLWLLAALYSLLTAVTSCVLSDGQQLLALFDVRSGACQSALWRRLARGQSFTSAERAIIAKHAAPTNEAPNSFDALASTIALCEGHVLAARPTLERAMNHPEGAPGILLELLLQATCVFSLIDRDLSRADAALSRACEVGKNMCPPDYLEIGRACLCAVRGERTEAQQALSRWNALVENANHPEQVSASHQWARTLLNETL